MAWWAMVGSWALAAPAARGVEAGVAPPPGLERAYASRRVALVVGIDRFNQPDVDDLAFAAKDATDLARVLEDPRVGGYDVVSVVAGEVGRDAFWSAFRSVASTVQRDDTVLVYVATHGTLDLGPGGAELFLLGSDSSLHDAADTAIRVAELSEALSALPARRTVMILDACYAGSGRSVVAPEVRRKLDHTRGAVPAPPALVASALSAHLYSAHLHQPALEDPALQNGVYTHFLIEALRGDGDVDGDGLVEVMEAHHWARDRTLAHTGGSQVPWAETVLVGRQELFLTGDPRRRTALEQALLDGLESLPADGSVDGTRRGAGPVRRRAPIELGVGALAAADRAWLGPLAAGVDLRAAPPGSHAWFGASARFGAATSGPARFPTGATLAEAGWAWQLGPVASGPYAGAGFVWRLPEGSQQASLAASAGAELTVGTGLLVGRVRAGAVGFAADGGPALIPTLSVGLATRLNP